MDTSPKDAAIDEVAFELRAALFPLFRRLQARRADDEVTIAEMSVLSRLDRFGPASPVVLAAKEYVRPQSMATILTQLHRRGFVSRGPHGSDRRSITISISDSGREALEAGRNERVRLLARAIGEAFTPDEIRLLAATVPLLRRLTEVV